MGYPEEMGRLADGGEAVEKGVPKLKGWRTAGEARLKWWRENAGSRWRGRRRERTRLQLGVHGSRDSMWWWSLQT